MTEETTELQRPIQIELENFQQILAHAFASERYVRMLLSSLFNIESNTEELSEQWRSSTTLRRHCEQILEHSKYTVDRLSEVAGDNASTFEEPKPLVH
jgi:hypothetical protein